MVLDPEAFLEEVEHLIARGVKIGTRLKIAPETHLIMPYHKTIDLESEKLRGKRKIGTTGRGIGPAYVDKIARIGIRVADLLDPEVFRDKLAHNIAEKNYLYQEIYGIGTLKARADLQALHGVRQADRAVRRRRLAHRRRGRARRQERALRGRAGDDARRRPRHLPLRDLLLGGLRAAPAPAPASGRPRSTRSSA